MAKPTKGDRAGQTPATDADPEQQSGELPQEPISNETDTPQPDADAGSWQDPHAGAGTAPLNGEQSTGATDADHEQQSGDEPAPAHDERVLVRFTGPWKNLSRGDITRLSPAEAELVFKKALAEAVAEPDLE
ncbi:hypothetical protein K3H44_09955 [Aeromonas veronii]|uniref:hypothetical protein n=1 Tax=Aeromonas veronii TaxID=654 RepID=UPI001F35581D|nr:hypothetical protein [Aeromonas veronii]MCF5855602.1 hypothetical protein [Aeromonas veronii]